MRVDALFIKINNNTNMTTDGWRVRYHETGAASGTRPVRARQAVHQYVLAAADGRLDKGEHGVGEVQHRGVAGAGVGG